MRTLTKAVITLSLCIFYSFTTYSQLECFFPDSDSYYSISTFKFWFEGDTLINNYKYKKVFMQTEETIANFNNAVYYAALREDTIAERIYCIQKEDGIERLIADYSLSPNDTISVFSFWPNINSPLKMTIEINSVDSILIGEIYHKRLSIDHDWASSEDIHESWIEGIGSSYGIFFPSSILNSLEVDYPRLLCVHINDTLYYQNEKYNNCYKDFSTQINSKNLNTNFNIHIENNKIVVDEGFEDFEYKIFDISGNILNIGIVYSNKIEISSLLNSGVYFLSLYENEGFNAFTSKFIIP